VDIGEVLAVLRANVELAKRTIVLAAGRIDPGRGCSCRRALDGAIITDRSAIPKRRLEELAVVAGRVLSGPEDRT